MGELHVSNLYQRYALDHFRNTFFADRWYAAVARGENTVIQAQNLAASLRCLQQAMVTAAPAAPTLLAGPPMLDAVSDTDEECIFEQECRGGAVGIENIAHVLGADAAGEDGPTPMCNVLLFRILHYKPSLLKRAYGDLSVRFSPDNIAVVVGRHLPILHGERCLYVVIRIGPEASSYSAIQMLNEAFFDGHMFKLMTFPEVA